MPTCSLHVDPKQLGTNSDHLDELGWYVLQWAHLDDSARIALQCTHLDAWVHVHVHSDHLDAWTRRAVQCTHLDEWMAKSIVTRNHLTHSGLTNVIPLLYNCSYEKN